MDWFMTEARQHHGMTNLERKVIESEYNESDTVGQTQQDCLPASNRKEPTLDILDLVGAAGLRMSEDLSKINMLIGKYGYKHAQSSLTLPHFTLPTRCPLLHAVTITTTFL